MNMKILVLQGPPASGKSTFARKWQAEDPVNRVIVSRDAIRHARGQYWVPQQERYISMVEQTSVIAALECGLNVCVDATNLNEGFINTWKEVANECNAELEFKLFDVPYEECVARDQNPDRAHHVGEAVIKRFFDKYSKNGKFSD